MEIHISVAPETLFMVGSVRVTNSLLTMFIVMGLLLVAGTIIARRAMIVPGRWQGIFEVTTEFILSLVESTGGRTLGRRIFPLIGAIFMFIALANYTTILPGIGTIGFYRAETAGETASAAAGEATAEPAATGETVAEGEGDQAEAHTKLVPLFRGPNADLSMTLAMALLTFTLVQIAGLRTHGVVGRIKHMAEPAFLLPIEIVSELGRIVSLSARLFGNVFAGEVLLAVMYAMANAIKIAIVPLFVPVVFIFLELLFGTIQALVFALLTAIYITLASSGGHGDKHAEHAESADQDHGAEEMTATRIAAGAGD